MLVYLWFLKAEANKVPYCYWDVRLTPAGGYITQKKLRKSIKLLQFKTLT